MAQCDHHVVISVCQPAHQAAAGAAHAAAGPATPQVSARMRPRLAVEWECLPKPDNACTYAGLEQLFIMVDLSRSSRVSRSRGKGAMDANV